MNKKGIIILSCSIVVLAAAVMAVRGYLSSTACWGKTQLYLRSSDAIFSPDERTAFFVMGPKYVQIAEGICAFPDGRARTLYSSVDVYALNLQTKSMKRIAVWQTPLEGGDLFTLTYKANGKAYVVGAAEPTMYLELDTTSGPARQLSRAEYESATSLLSRFRGSFDVTKDNRFIELTQEAGEYALVEKQVRLSPEGFNQVAVKQILLRGVGWLPYQF